jgi:hypothetical protein
MTWAQDLIRLSGMDGILTPIRIEFLCGVHSKRRYELSSVYLSEFRVYDEGKISKADWAAAERHASRVPRDGSRRQLADYLIRVIADRLHCDVLTSDRRFPQLAPIRSGLPLINPASITAVITPYSGL